MYVSTSPNFLKKYFLFRPNPGRRKKINLNFYFHTSLSCLKRSQGPQVPHKTFWGTTKKCENNNFYFNTTCKERVVLILCLKELTLIADFKLLRRDRNRDSFNFLLEECIRGHSKSISLAKWHFLIPPPPMSQTF